LGLFRNTLWKFCIVSVSCRDLKLYVNYWTDREVLFFCIRDSVDSVRRPLEDLILCVCVYISSVSIKCDEKHWGASKISEEHRGTANSTKKHREASRSFEEHPGTSRSTEEHLDIEVRQSVQFVVGLHLREFLHLPRDVREIKYFLVDFVYLSLAADVNDKENVLNRCEKTQTRQCNFSGYFSNARIFLFFRIS